MTYTQIPSNTFEKLQLNAGVILSEFDPETATVDRSKIIGATSGGVNFTATPNFVDFGEDIDNCPKNTKELKKITDYEVSISGTMLTLDTAVAKALVAAADVSGNKITPRHELKTDDFNDIWWVGDYGEDGGIAIRMKDALSTGGFAIQTGDKSKGQFAFTYTAHYSIENPDDVPFEVYVMEGA